MTSTPFHPRARSGDAGTSAPALDSLTLHSPDALVCAIPYLLGFHPRDSAVLVWLGGGRIMLTQRLDLPRRRRELAPWQQAAWTHAAADTADEVIAILVCADGYEHVEAIAESLLLSARDHGVAVRDLIRHDGHRWRSLLCADQDCCPDVGRAVDPAVQARVAAEFTLLGRAPLADRAEVAESLGADPEVVAEVAQRIDRIDESDPGRDDAGRDEWRDEAVDALTEHLVGASPPDPHDPELLARLLMSLADIRVRDTLLWELARLSPDRLATALDRAIGLLRAATAGRVAPVATCVAVVAWLLGDGARATMAIERARTDDPDYTLAALVEASLAAGLPPGAWRDAMGDLTREECRFGPTQR